MAMTLRHVTCQAWTTRRLTVTSVDNSQGTGQADSLPMGKQLDGLAAELAVCLANATSGISALMFDGEQGFEVVTWLQR